MSTVQNNEKEFYKRLGKLCYAIAKADGYVVQNEIASLKKVLNSPDIDSYFKREYIPLIVSTFEKVNHKKQDAETCFNEFITFKRENENLFSTAINKVIMQITGKIASGYAGKNKSELIILAKLNLELKKTTL